MRKAFIALTALLLAIWTAGPAYAAPQVVLNGRILTFQDTQPFIENGRTLVPLRPVFEAMGVQVRWDGDTRTVTATRAGTEIKLVIGGPAYRNGNPVYLEVPARIIDGRTVVPLRFVSEALGCMVAWNPAAQTVNIVSPGQNRIPCKVTRVLEGDTIEVDLGGRREKVRLIGVSTPETVRPAPGEEPYRKQASNYAREKLTGQQVDLELDVQERDDYGQLLGYVWLQNILFNYELVNQGYAQIMAIPPNIRHVDVLIAAQKEAMEAARGLWSALVGDSDPPPAGLPEAAAGKYVGSKKSDKYHLPGCQWAKKINQEYQVWFKDEAAARAAGYQPCGACRP